MRFHLCIGYTFQVFQCALYAHNQIPLFRQQKTCTLRQPAPRTHGRSPPLRKIFKERKALIEKKGGTERSIQGQKAVLPYSPSSRPCEHKLFPVVHERPVYYGVDGHGYDSDGHEVNCEHKQEASRPWIKLLQKCTQVLVSGVQHQ